MSVIVVGDRGVGKTTMVHYLADTSNADRVKVEKGPDPTVRDDLEPTEELQLDEPIKMEVNLSTFRRIQVQWTDTPGEAFTRRGWRDDHAAAWEGIKAKMSQSKYLILLLPPHRGIIKSSLLASDHSRRELDNFPTAQVWQNRIAEWLNFFTKECPTTKHLLICIHAIDLVNENIDHEEAQWRYEINEFKWSDYSQTVYNTYFRGLDDVLSQYKRKHRSQLLSFFMTTIKHRTLLELPWLYIGSYEKPST